MSESVISITETSARGGSLATRLTRREIDHSFSRIFELLLYAYFVLFSLSNVYYSPVSQALTNLKWAPLFLIVILLFTKTINSNRSALYARGNLIPLTIVFFLAFSTFLNGNYFASASVLISLILTFWAALYLGGSFERMSRTITILRNVGMMIIASSAVLNLAGINLGRGQPRFSGWVDNPNTLAMMIVPTIVVLVWQLTLPRKNKMFFALFLVAGLWVLFESQSRASIGWVAVSTSILLLIRIKSQLIVILGSAAVMLFAVGSDMVWDRTLGTVSREDAVEDADLLSGRDEVWAFARERIQEKPIFGFGSGSSEPLVRYNYHRFLHHSGVQIHSSYLTAAVEGGLIVAAILTIALIVAAWRAFLKARYFNANFRAIKYQRELSRLSFAMLVGAAFHGAFETWMLSAGNSNTLWFWALILGSISLRISSKTRRRFV